MEWRDSGRRLTFFGVDGRVTGFLILVLYHPRLWTFGLMLLCVCVLIFLERKGYNLPNAMRKVRVFLTGNKKAAVSSRRVQRTDL